MARLNTYGAAARVDLALPVPTDLLDDLPDVAAAHTAFLAAVEAMDANSEAVGELDDLKRRHAAEARAAGAAGRERVASIDPDYLEGRAATLRAETTRVRTAARSAAEALGARIVEARPVIRAARVEQLARARQHAAGAIAAARQADDKMRALASEVASLDASAALAIGQAAQPIADYYRANAYVRDPYYTQRPGEPLGQTQRANAWTFLASCAAGLRPEAYRPDPFDDEEVRAALRADPRRSSPRSHGGERVMTDAQRRAALLAKAGR